MLYNVRTTLANWGWDKTLVFFQEARNCQCTTVFLKQESVTKAAPQTWQVHREEMEKSAWKKRERDLWGEKKRERDRVESSSSSSSSSSFTDTGSHTFLRSSF